MKNKHIAAGELNSLINMLHWALIKCFDDKSFIGPSTLSQVYLYSATMGVFDCLLGEHKKNNIDFSDDDEIEIPPLVIRLYFHKSALKCLHIGLYHEVERNKGGFSKEKYCNLIDIIKTGFLSEGNWCED